MATGTETTLSLEQPAPTKLYQAMHKARAAMKVVGKSGFNKFDNYAYATLADYLEAIQKPLDDNGVLVVSYIDDIKWLDDRITDRGKAEKVCRIMLRTTAIHAESGESLSVIVLGEGQDRGDKAFYKADTGARKYALANLFNLATDEDPETDSPQNERPASNGSTQKRDAAPATQQAKPAATTFAPPPNWPDTALPDLASWTAALPSMAALKTGLGMFAAEPSLQSVLPEWEKLMTVVASKYKVLTDGFKKNRDAEIELQIKMILKKIALDKQGQETFSPPATEQAAS